MSSPDVFLSYNREDAAIARLYAEAFAGAGLDVWWDATLRSGEDYDAVTEDALRSAKAVVVLWSPRSVASRWVRAEATIADRNQTLMPATIEACNRPVMFELKQTAELSHWRGDLQDKDWLAFVADVRRKVGRSASEPVDAVPAAQHSASPGNGSTERSAVAVLPFSCRSGDGELEMLAEDLTEDVTRELAYNGYFKVIAAGTMAAWRGKPIDHKELGRKLEARYLVDGKLQRSGRDTRLTAQLIEAASGNVLWSTRMVSNSEDTDFSADTLPVAVATQFAEQIVQHELTRAMTRRPPFSGWDHILRSAAFSMRAGPDGARLGVEEARLAVAAAPDIGLAHAALAGALAALPEAAGHELGDAGIREIQAHIKQAMQLDGNNPTVLMALAGAYQGLEEYEICLRLARRTVELCPSSPFSYLILGNSFRMLGRTAEAIGAYRKQDRLSPFDSSRNVALTYLGMCLLLEGQPEAAEAELDRALTLSPEFAVTLKWKAIVAAGLGKQRAALDAIRQLRSGEAALSLDQHVWQIERYEHLRERTTEHVAALRRLWDATGTGAAGVAEPGDGQAGQPGESEREVPADADMPSVAAIPLTAEALSEPGTLAVEEAASAEAAVQDSVDAPAAAAEEFGSAPESGSEAPESDATAPVPEFALADEALAAEPAKPPARVRARKQPGAKTQARAKSGAGDGARSAMLGEALADQGSEALITGVPPAADDRAASHGTDAAKREPVSATAKAGLPRPGELSSRASAAFDTADADFAESRGTPATLIGSLGGDAVMPGLHGEPANDDELSPAGKRKPRLLRMAALAGALAATGIGAAVYMSQNRIETDPEIAAAFPAPAPGSATPLAAVAAAPSETAAAPQPLTGEINSLIAAARNARRPQAEMAALAAGKRSLEALLTQIQAEPANAELAAQLDGAAAGIARQQGAALSAAGDQWLREQQQKAAGASRKMAPGDAANVQRSLAKARDARAGLASAVASANQAPSALQSIRAARQAFTAYGRLLASPVNLAATSVSAAPTDGAEQSSKLLNRLSQRRSQIEFGQGGACRGCWAGGATGQYRKAGIVRIRRQAAIAQAAQGQCRPFARAGERSRTDFRARRHGDRPQPAQFDAVADQRPQRASRVAACLVELGAKAGWQRDRGRTRQEVIAAIYTPPSGPYRELVFPGADRCRPCLTAAPCSAH